MHAISEPPSGLSFDGKTQILSIGTDFLRDYFRTVGAILSEGSEAELIAFRSADEPIDALRSHQQEYGNAADGLDMVDRYISSLANGSDEDKRIWKVAIEREAADLLFEGKRHLCAIPIFEIMQAAAESAVNLINSPECTSEKLKRHGYFFNQLANCVEEMDLRVGWTGLKFVDSANLINKIKDEMEMEGLAVDEAGNLKFDLSCLNEAEKLHINLHSEEGLSALQELIESHTDIWFPYFKGDLNDLLSSLADHLADVRVAYVRAQKAQAEYDEVF